MKDYAQIKARRTTKLRLRHDERLRPVYGISARLRAEWWPRLRHSNNFFFFFKTHDYASDGSPDQAGNFLTKQCSCYGTINSRQDRALHLHMHDKQCIISVRGRPVNSTPKVEYY